MPKRRLYIIMTSLVVAFNLSRCGFIAQAMTNPPQEGNSNMPSIILSLPQPSFESAISIEEALLKRRSIRDYIEGALTLEELSQLLWAAQGITEPPFYKTSPSAGALYPLEIYIAAGNVKDLSAGIYHYQPEGHQISLILEGDKRKKLYESALRQSSVREAPAVIIICGVYSRTTKRYHKRGIRYVHMEVGHTAQNICLQAVSLHLGAVVIGAFDDDDIKEVLFSHTTEEEPLYMIPIGRIH
ncbi:MAG: SagB/ThcOx family dehydrogenase [bacterium]